MFRKAERKKAKLRLGIVGPAGSGKTYGALLVAMGLGGRIAMIDTENGSGDLYAGLGDYDVCTLAAPYEVQKYLAAIHDAERAGYDVLIIDSLSHAWAGEGGLLDQQGKIADAGRGNSYTAWRKITPLHNQLVEAMLASPCHIIATMRAKTEYILEENERGKKEPKKVGMAPVQRDGMDYEFGVVFDLSGNHSAQVSKDRTSLFDGRVFQLSKGTGETLRAWLETGAEPPSAMSDAERLKLWKWYLEHFGDEERAKKEVLSLTQGRGSRQWTDADIRALEEGKERLTSKELGEAAWEDKNAGGEIIPEMFTPDENSTPAPAPVIPADEESPEEQVKAKIRQITGPEGLYLTGGDLEALLYETTKKTELDKMSLAELRKVEKAARAEWGKDKR